MCGRLRHAMTASEEYFQRIRELRGGVELYNVTGDKVRVLKDFIDKSAKRVKDREDAKNAPPYQVRRVNELLEQRKNAMVLKRINNFPMTLATKYTICGDEIHVREQLDKGYPINFRDGGTGRGLLHEAAVHGHLPIIRLLCREYHADANILTILGSVNPLHLSVAHNHRQISVILCQHGCNPNHQDTTGSTPLHYVRSKTVLKVLLRSGADPRIRNNRGETPREHYKNTTESYLQDMYILKKLLQVEEAYQKEEYKKQLNDLQMKHSDVTVAKTTQPFHPLIRDK